MTNETKEEHQIERLQEAIALILDTYTLPLQEIKALLYAEDYPPLEEGDLGIYEEQIFTEVWG